MDRRGVSEVAGTMILIGIVVVGMMIVNLVIFSSPTQTRVPSLQASLTNKSTLISIVHEGGDSLQPGEFQILVDGIDQTANFTNSGSYPWSIGETLSYNAPSMPHRAVMVYNGSGRAGIEILSTKFPWGVYVPPTSGGSGGLGGGGGGTTTTTPGSCVVAIDTTSSGKNTTPTSGITISHTTSGLDRLMLVGVSMGFDNHEAVSTITYNGVALTRVGAITHPQSDVRTEIWQLIAPDTGTYNVVITFNKTLSLVAGAGVMTFTGTDQTSPLGTFASQAGSDDHQINVTVPSAAGEMVLGVITNEYNTVITDGSQTEQWNLHMLGSPSDSNSAGSTEGRSGVRAHEMDPEQHVQPLGNGRCVRQAVQRVHPDPHPDGHARPIVVRL